MVSPHDVLLCSRRFDVNFLIMDIDMVNSSFGTNPVQLRMPGGEGRLFRTGSGCHTRTQGFIVRKQRFAGALGERRNDQQESNGAVKRPVHVGMFFHFKVLSGQVPEWN